MISEKFNPDVETSAKSKGDESERKNQPRKTVD